MILENRYGVYSSLAEANEHQRPTMYVPCSNGHVYMIEKGSVFTTVKKAKTVPGVSSPLREGIHFSLPKIPFPLLEEFISLARLYAYEVHTEVFAEIYWNEDTKEYKLFIPKQLAKREVVIPQEAYITDLVKVMEIHSHHFWEAIPSSIDDEADSKSTRGILFGIIGKIDQLFPDIYVRAYVDGEFIPVNAADIFESPFKKHHFELLPQVEVNK